ncbi:MAG TPA: hypothetical protein PKD49_11645 [Hyphomicrobium sp.]|nr:hypothetical protein [Hyphomicrobium sp.]
MKVGDRVTVVKIPEDLPEDNTSLLRLFNGCLGKTFDIAAFDGDLAELHVGEAFGDAKEKHRIWLPREYLKLAKA